jgi:uncharacterized protein YbjT (DUF2867 family)
MQSKIIVTGATGTVGSEVVKALHNKGYKVVAALHKGSSGQKREKITLQNVSFAEVDYSQPDTLDAIFEPGASLFMLTPYNPEQKQIAHTLASAALRKGISHIVLLSGFNVTDEKPIEIARSLIAGEEAVKATGIPYTFLRACSFMQNFINYYGPQPDGNIYMPVGMAAMNFIDVRDIAKVAAIALTEPGHENKAYRLATVAHPIADIAAMLTEATGKTIRYVDVPAEAIAQGMRQYGVPEWMIEQNLELYAAAKEGRYTRTSTDFEQVTGKAPISFSTFTHDYREHFRAVVNEVAVP